MKDAIIDAVIPVYKPGVELKELIRRLELQKVKIRHIYLMHTEDGYDLGQFEFLKMYDNIFIKEVSLRNFDHGGTRDKGFSLSDAEYVLCMTQDAIPADSFMTEKLLASMEDDKVALAYARQIPKRECHLIERYTRKFNYPAKNIIKSKEDLGRLGIKTYFCSNVCALYRKAIYEEQGGFEEKIIISEDTIYAARCIQNGYKVCYTAEAKVIHSHNYTNVQQFHRNFDIAVAQAQYPEIFAEIKSETEGIQMVKQTAQYLIRSRQPLLLIVLFLSSAAKYLGFFMGKHYKCLPHKIILKCTMNPRYWERL